MYIKVHFDIIISTFDFTQLKLPECGKRFKFLQRYVYTLQRPLIWTKSCVSKRKVYVCLLYMVTFLMKDVLCVVPME